jgi:small subunit ribosomal protein S6
MVKQYETVFIMTPVLSDQQIKETVKKYQSLLADNKAEIVFEHNWGMKKLAYPIQKKTTGFYYLIEFKSEPALIATLETAYKRDEKLLRFLTIVLDKHSIAYNEKKRANGLKSQQAKKQEVKEAPIIKEVPVIDEPLNTEEN